MGRLGGGGPQTLWGFQLQRRQSARVGLAAGIGPDLPPACLERLRHYGIDTAGLLTHVHKTPRAWQLSGRGALRLGRLHAKQLRSTIVLVPSAADSSVDSL